MVIVSRNDAVEHERTKCALQRSEMLSTSTQSGYGYLDQSALPKVVSEIQCYDVTPSTMPNKLSSSSADGTLTSSPQNNP
jgi:hypothetical protein